MKDEINHNIPDSRIIADLAGVIWDEGGGTIEFDDGQLFIPSGVQLEVIAKSLHTYSYDIGFGHHYQVQVAIGGVTSLEHGIVDARYCFATLFYNLALKLITIDFHREMR